ncbi:AbrB family transcriptional regulator [Paenibacillus chitinolyticus]|uniref:AbrB/MazE/SpoVT family DNA-binding domain-containing protein n=1 Tax=Paenibacillus chitinolyticus TaxID=79263 RepID=UPI0026E4CFB2|nr:AbrB/MazE/SpoVT family DNA-binding domain-containing protein [Paenibacillus chitinolyticus]GKS14742.1 AbrB family transcriptional regulator [Paenibacillus chitinolyticus]
MIKSTGMVRNVDSLGRIVLPKELRRTLGMPVNEPLEIFVEGDRIILKKYAPGCILCGNIEGIQAFRDKAVCSSCLRDFKKVAAGSPA